MYNRNSKRETDRFYIIFRICEVNKNKNKNLKMSHRLHKPNVILIKGTTNVYMYTCVCSVSCIKHIPMAMYRITNNNPTEPYVIWIEYQPPKYVSINISTSSMHTNK